MAKTIKVEFQSGQCALELTYGEDSDQAFVTVRHIADSEDDQRGIYLKPEDALELAQALIEYGTIALKDLARYVARTEED